MRKPEFMQPAGALWECHLCPNRCRIASGKRGRCLGRGVDPEPVLYNFGQVVAAHLDPIEKKPLYHFHPGSSILSVGTFGCNLSCRFCQNCEISQEVVSGETISPAELATRSASLPGNLGVAFTYTEPGIWYEYVMDVAELLRKRGQKVVLVTNGYLDEEPWKNLCTRTDAMNIDLKAFTEEFYQKICGGQLAPVLRNIELAVAAGVRVELTNLVIPGLNDDPGPFTEMIAWIAGVSPDLPLHLSRYYPRFRETAPPTPPETLLRLHSIARERLAWVYVGNLATSQGQNTVCPDCHTTLIQRDGYDIRLRMTGDTCACGRRIPVIGNPLPR